MVAERKPLPLEPLTATSTIDGRYRRNTADLAEHASEYALIKARMEIEGRYLVAMSDVGVVRPFTSQERKKLTAMGPNLSIEDARKVKEIEDRTNHDVDAMKNVMKELFVGTSLEDAAEKVHLAITSEDINNLAYRTLIVRARDNVVVPAIEVVTDKLVGMAEEYSDTRILGRTHGQPAVTSILGKEVVNFAARLHEQTEELKSQQLKGKLNGAVGSFNAHRYAMPTVDWIKFSQDFVKNLGFKPNLITTQINTYEDIITHFQNLKRVNGVVIDLDQDMWRYISDDWFSQKVVAGERGSSTMTQKVNPIDFENSEGNALLANGMLDTMGTILSSSRLQRDLRDSTVIRNFGTAMAHGLIAYKSTLRGLGKVYPNPEQISADLNKNWSILTEAIQIDMRTEGDVDAYNMIAEKARGVRLRGQGEWKAWIDELPVSEEQKEKYKQLKPEDYIGYAQELTEMAITEIRSSRTPSHF